MNSLQLIINIIVLLFKLYQIVLALKYCYHCEKLLSLKHSIYSFLFKKSDNLKD